MEWDWRRWGLTGAFAVALCTGGHADDPAASDDVKKDDAREVQAASTDRENLYKNLPKPKSIAPFVEKGIAWLIKAQHDNGGWGAGSHSRQNVRNPRAVTTDPATTAFVALALIRVGNTPQEGKFSEALMRATLHLVSLVEKAPEKGAFITDLRGTQPQTKLGQYVDTAMTVQFLSRIVPMLPEQNKLHTRADAALDKCLAKLAATQNDDGSWKGGTWAGQLQSSLACTAFELACAIGKKIDADKLMAAREYNKDTIQVGGADAAVAPAATAPATATGAVIAEDRESLAVPGRAIFGPGSTRPRTGFALDATGSVLVDASKSAGIALYAWSASQRASANEARAAQALIAEAKRKGELGQDEEVSTENLVKIGVKHERALQLQKAVVVIKEAVKQVDNERLLAGFGNNGGEEFLSYMMTSESFVISGGEGWAKWREKMHTRLKKIQSDNGSWSGHHCLTSPVFCTAAVVQTLTADHDGPFLARIAQSDAKLAVANKDK